MHFTGAQGSLSKIRSLASLLPQSDRSNFCFFVLQCLALACEKDSNAGWSCLQWLPIPRSLCAAQPWTPRQVQAPLWAMAGPPRAGCCSGSQQPWGPREGGKEKPESRAKLRPSREGSGFSTVRRLGHTGPSDWVSSPSLTPCPSPAPLSLFICPPWEGEPLIS